MSSKFEEQIKAFAEKAKQRTDKVYRGSIFDLFSNIVIATPVDKGVLRNGWIVNISIPSTEAPRTNDASGSTALRNAQSVLNGVNFTKQVYINNNLPYAERIEYDGWSQKAPAGMVRVNVARWETIVKNNVVKYAK